ncbi:MAG: hypothetical protein MRZ49_00820 [Lachnospiraceae bacterium]|nr:hypothetical protein [Lachnospiraceae bacterium]
MSDNERCVDGKKSVRCELARKRTRNLPRPHRVTTDSEMKRSGIEQLSVRGNAEQRSGEC